MPLVSQTFDQLLDFTRTTSGTFVGSNGLIQLTPASVNLLTQTQQFDNAAWTKTAATVTADTTVAPDGTSTADTITEDTTAASTHRVTRTFATTAVSHTASVYFKANTRSWGYIRLTDSGGNFRHAYFNLSTGTLGTVETNLTASITSVGNGWYRCVATVNVANTTSTTVFGIADADGGATYNGNGTGSIFIWGAQYEAAATASTYTRNNGGVYPPRFDYDPVTLQPKGILNEEQRVNLLTYSNDFTNGIWNKSNSSLTTGISDPAGGTSATTLTATSAFGLVQEAPTSTASITYAASMWIRRRTGTGQVSFRCGDASPLIPVTVTSSWVRYTVTGIPSTTTVRIAVVLDISGDEVDIYGAQLEAGAFATSYIPTVASQVTRAADQTRIVAPNFAPWYNQSEGTFVFEGSSVAPSTLAQTLNALGANDGTNNNTHRVGRFSNFWFGETRDGNVQQAAPSAAGGSYAQNTTAKVAYAYKTNDFALSANGAAAVTDTSGTVPTVITRLDVGGPTIQLNGHVRSIRYYPVRLSDAQLQALTA